MPLVHSDHQAVWMEMSRTMRSDARFAQPNPYPIRSARTAIVAENIERVITAAVERHCGRHQPKLGQLPVNDNRWNAYNQEV